MLFASNRLEIHSSSGSATKKITPRLVQDQVKSAPVFTKTEIRVIIKPIVNPEKNSPTGSPDNGKGPDEYKKPTAKQNTPSQSKVSPSWVTR